MYDRVHHVSLENLNILRLLCEFTVVPCRALVHSLGTVYHRPNEKLPFYLNDGISVEGIIQVILLIIVPILQM